MAGNYTFGIVDYKIEITLSNGRFKMLDKRT
jgi:hypothetical protein